MLSTIGEDGMSGELAAIFRDAIGAEMLPNWHGFFNGWMFRINPKALIPIPLPKTSMKIERHDDD